MDPKCWVDVPTLFLFFDNLSSILVMILRPVTYWVDVY